jgi:hypothetical protein
MNLGCCPICLTVFHCPFICLTISSNANKVLSLIHLECVIHIVFQLNIGFAVDFSYLIVIKWIYLFWVWEITIRKIQVSNINSLHNVKVLSILSSIIQNNRKCCTICISRISCSSIISVISCISRICCV